MSFTHLRLVREVLLVCLIVSALLVFLSTLEKPLHLSHYLSVLVAMTFFGTAVYLGDKLFVSAEALGIPLDAPAGRLIRTLFSEMAVAILICACIFPPYALGFYWYTRPSAPFRFSQAFTSLAHWPHQMILIAIPEEAFFRGYVQTRLAHAWPSTLRIFGGAVPSKALVFQAVIFGLMHLTMSPSLYRLSVFFPALLFGWVRFIRGDIVAACFIHAFCNIYSEFLTQGWFYAE